MKPKERETVPLEVRIYDAQVEIAIAQGFKEDLLPTWREWHKQEIKFSPKGEA